VTRIGPSVARGAACGLTVLALAACSGPSTDPVPTTASSPYVCTGVQQEGADLALGGSSTSDRQRGTWGDDPVGFNCQVDGPSGSILVNEKPVAAGSTWGSNGPDVLVTLKRQGLAAPIDATQPGAGYMFGDGSAGWVCGERFLLIQILDADTKGRDARADAGNLLVSMLPWTCGDAEVPS